MSMIRFLALPLAFILFTCACGPTEAELRRRAAYTAEQEALRKKQAAAEQRRRASLKPFLEELNATRQANTVPAAKLDALRAFVRQECRLDDTATLSFLTEAPQPSLAQDRWLHVTVGCQSTDQRIIITSHEYVPTRWNWVNGHGEFYRWQTRHRVVDVDGNGVPEHVTDYRDDHHGIIHTMAYDTTSYLHQHLGHDRRNAMDHWEECGIASQQYYVDQVQLAIEFWNLNPN